MKEILFGMAVGGVLGMLLYKNSSCAKQFYDKGEKMIMEEMNKIDKTISSPKSQKKLKKTSN